MNTIAAIVLLVLMPVCAGLNCYFCASGLTGCNDPFNANSANVTQTGAISANLYCVKSSLTSSVTMRSGAPTCTSIPFVLGIGTACCMTDLCNAAHTNYQLPSLIILSVLIMLHKFY